MIGGLAKNSFVDYPGKVCTTIFIQGCNFSCPFCQNPGLVPMNIEYEYVFEKIIEYLSEAKKIVDAVCFSGGEPTLDPKLPEYIKAVKEMGLLVKLDTNGWNPEFLKLDVNYVAMDIKTSLSNYRNFCNIQNIENKIKESINFLTSQNKIGYEFRTTLVPGLVTEKEIKEIGELIQGAPSWFLQQYKNKNTLDPSYKDVKPYSIEENERLLRTAKKYLKNTTLR